jgi:hypothetical protein
VAGDGEEEAAGEKERRGRGGEDLGGGCEIKARVLPGAQASAVAALRHCCRDVSRNRSVGASATVVELRGVRPDICCWTATAEASRDGQRPRRVMRDSDARSRTSTHATPISSPHSKGMSSGRYRRQIAQCLNKQKQSFSLLKTVAGSFFYLLHVAVPHASSLLTTLPFACGSHIVTRAAYLLPCVWLVFALCIMNTHLRFVYFERLNNSIGNIPSSNC